MITFTYLFRQSLGRICNVLGTILDMDRVWTGHPSLHRAILWNTDSQPVLGKWTLCQKVVRSMGKVRKEQSPRGTDLRLETSRNSWRMVREQNKVLPFCHRLLHWQRSSLANVRKWGFKPESAIWKTVREMQRDRVTSGTKERPRQIWNCWDQDKGKWDSAELGGHGITCNPRVAEARCR